MKTNSTQIARSPAPRTEANLTTDEHRSTRIEYKCIRLNLSSVSICVYPWLNSIFRIGFFVEEEKIPHPNPPPGVPGGGDWRDYFGALRRNRNREPSRLVT